MLVNFGDFKYGRYTAINFTKDEFINNTKYLDYAFFVSPEINNQIPNFHTIQKQSAWLLIRDSEENQILNYQPTCRNEVRRSFRTLEFSIEINTTPIEELFLFHKTCEFERGWLPVPMEELSSSIVICIRYLDELIAGMSAYFQKDFIRIGRIFTRRKSEKYQNLQQVLISSASRRVMHEFTNFARANNFNFLDMGGVSFDDPLKSGITKYKLSFGAQIKDMHLTRFEGLNYNELISQTKLRGLDLT